MLVQIPPENLVFVNPTECQKKKISVHHGLAERLLARADQDPAVRAWFDVMPTFDDFIKCMPLLWPQDISVRLPRGASGTDRPSA